MKRRSELFADSSAPTDDLCHAWLVAQRWPKGVKCPRGHTARVWYSPERRLWQCGKCERQFSVTAGTILHKRKLPLSKIVQAARIMVGRPTITALQLHRELGISKNYSTVYYLHRKFRARLPKRDPVATLLLAKP